MNEKGWPSFKVMIGKAVLRVACERVELIEEFNHRYAGFISNDEAQMDVLVRVTQHGNPSGLLNVKPIFLERRVAIDTPDYRGVVDLQHGLSEISLPAQRLAEDTEYFLRLVTALVVYHAGGLMFHAAAIASEKQVHVFFGHSGSGKTTIARNSSGKRVLNDDLVLLQREGEYWYASSTPFWNPTQVKPLNLSGKIHALYQLVQDRHVVLEPVSPAIALAEFLANVPVMNGDPTRGQELVDRCLEIVNSVPVYRLHFLPDGTFWSVLEDS